MMSKRWLRLRHPRLYRRHLRQSRCAQRGELVVSLQCPMGQCGALLREVLR